MHAAVPNQGIAWKPGFARHVPWLAFLCILGFAVCCAGLDAVLWLSDEKDITTWPTPSHRVSVSVLLALLVSVGNLFSPSDRAAASPSGCRLLRASN